MKTYTISDIIRVWLTRLGWKLIKSNCTHKQKKFVSEHYQERYAKYWCEDCRSYIYEGWDD